MFAAGLARTSATKLSLQLKVNGIISSAVLLVNHERQDVAEQASDLLKKLLSSTAVRTGVPYPM